MNTNEFKEQLYRKTLNKAVQLLALRDYSSVGLSSKLSLYAEKQINYFNNKHKDTHIFDENDDSENGGWLSEHSTLMQSIVNDVVDVCSHKKWINDDEFVEKYTRMRTNKGFGRDRIIMELTKQGFGDEAVEEALTQADLDNMIVMKQALEKKFKQYEYPTDFKIRQKMKQFLYYRGFPQEDITELFQQLKHEME